MLAKRKIQVLLHSTEFEPTPTAMRVVAALKLLVEHRKYPSRHRIESFAKARLLRSFGRFFFSSLSRSFPMLTHIPPAFLHGCASLLHPVLFGYDAGSEPKKKNSSLAIRLRLTAVFF